MKQMRESAHANISPLQVRDILEKKAEIIVVDDEQEKEKENDEKDLNASLSDVDEVERNSPPLVPIPSSVEP